MLSPVRLSVVCLSVCNVRAPYSGSSNFRNISTALGTLATRWHPLKISRRSSQGNPSEAPPGELNTGGIAKYTDFGPIDGYILETVQIGGKLLLISNRKSYMSFRFVTKSVTLNDRERRNGRYFAFCVISSNSGSFRGALRKSGFKIYT